MSTYKLFQSDEVYECDLERNYNLMKEVILSVHSLWALGVPILGEFEES